MILLLHTYGNQIRIHICSPQIFWGEVTQQFSKISFLFEYTSSPWTPTPTNLCARRMCLNYRREIRSLEWPPLVPTILRYLHCAEGVCGQAIKHDCSARLPTSSTQQSNNNDMGNGDGNKVAGNKDGDGKGGKGNGDGNKGGGQATATTWAMALATRVVGNEEGDGKGGKGGGYNAEEGHGNRDSMGNGDGNEGGGHQRGQCQGKWQGRQGQW
jgi:hypothetical protein